MVARLGDAVWFIRSDTNFFSGWLPFAARLITSGKQVFLDLKLHDIGNTVTKGVESVAQMRYVPDGSRLSANHEGCS